MSKKLFLLVVLFFTGLSLMAATPKRFTLVIDPGHGGHDTGALGEFSREKDINLSVALQFGRYVETHCADVKVIYTRKTDCFVTLHERAAIANRAKADLFVSVHTNAVARGHTVEGFQVYTLGMHRAKDNLDVAMRENSVISMEKDYKEAYQGFDPNSSESYIMFEFIQSANMEKSVELARFIQNSVCTGVGRMDKGVHQAGFLVLRETSMPSCLIELGFITTPSEEEYLNTDAGQDNMARAFYEAFVRYRKKYDPKLTVPTQGAARVSVSRTVAKPLAVKAQTDKLRPVAVQNVPLAAKNQPKAEVTTASAAPSSTTQPQLPPEAQEAIKDVTPTFKVQIFVSDRKLQSDSEHFKGHDNVGFFKEKGLYKYTVGSSKNYNEIMRLRKKLIKDFPQCFIIAFNGQNRMNTSLAIAAFLEQMKKQ